MDNEYKVGALCELIASNGNKKKTKKGRTLYMCILFKVMYINFQLYYGLFVSYDILHTTYQNYITYSRGSQTFTTRGALLELKFAH
jgi:hypothetical protein